MVAGIGSLVYEQRLFLMPAFRGQLVPIVQACHVGLESDEVFLLQTQIASTCCWGIGLCSCNQFPLYVKRITDEGPEERANNRVGSRNKFVERRVHELVEKLPKYYCRYYAPSLS